MKKNITAFAIVGLIVIGGAAYAKFDHSSSLTATVSESINKDKHLLENPTDLNLSNVTPKVTATPGVAEGIAEIGEPPEGYIIYKNKKFGFSFYHSPVSKIKEFDEGGGAMTVALENEQKKRGLQVFIVPYGNDVITEERFLKDVPSGVRYNIEQTTVGELKVPAVAFNSFDQFLGETREVWFIFDGYLYEVTTFKGMGDWFVPIMKTWRFNRGDN